MGLVGNCLTCQSSTDVPPVAQGISTCLSATATQEGPTPELYLKLCPLLSRVRPWAEQSLSFASRARGLGRGFVRLYHPHGPWGARGKREARLGLWPLEKVWPNISARPRAFMWCQQPGSQGTNQLPLTTSLCQQLTVATPTSTVASHHSGAVFCSTMCTLPTHSLSLVVGIRSPCQEAYSAWPSVCLAPAGLPVRPVKAISARGGHAAMAGSGSSMGRRFSSGGGHLRNSPCIMTGRCLKYPGGLRLPLSIPLTLTLTSFLTTSELTQSSPISCSSFHHWAPTPACCSAGLPCWVTT